MRTFDSRTCDCVRVNLNNLFDCIDALIEREIIEYDAIAYLRRFSTSIRRLMVRFFGAIRHTLTRSRINNVQAHRLYNSCMLLQRIAAERFHEHSHTFTCHFEWACVDRSESIAQL